MTGTPIGRAVRTLLGWTAAFAAIGLALGLAAMFARVSPFAESGSSSPSLRRYVGWIPILTGIGTAVGLTLGTLAAIIGAIGRARSRDKDARAA